MKKILALMLMGIAGVASADTALIVGDGSIVGACQIQDIAIDYASPGNRVKIGNHATYRKNISLNMGCPVGVNYRLFVDNSSSAVPVKLDGTGGNTSMNVYVNIFKDAGFSQYMEYDNGLLGTGTGNLSSVNLYAELSSSIGMFTEFTNVNVQYGFLNNTLISQLFVEF